MGMEEIKEMLERAASNGEEITPEDFYFIMTKKTFVWLKEEDNNYLELLIDLLNNALL